MNSESPQLFQTIEPPKTPWTRWIISFLVHSAVIAAILAIPVAVHQTIAPKWNETKLVAPPLPVTPPPPVHIKAPKPLPAPKVAFKEPLIKPPVVKPVVLPPPEPPKVEPKKVEIKIEAPRVEVAKAIVHPKFDAPVPTPAQPAPPKPAVKTDVFAANQPAPSGAKKEDSVKMGGFGDPNGVKPSATSTGKGVVVGQLGSFDMAQGSGNGGRNGTGKVVASAGFGSSGVPGTPGYGSSGPRGTVQSAGFNQAKVEAPAAKSVREAAPNETPVEILAKPKPAYTAEARQLKLEGEVLLEVLFTANGQIQVIRTVRGLGHGLDESARTAAQQIRFHPGTRGGSPVDMKGVVHIVFELS